MWSAIFRRPIARVDRRAVWLLVLGSCLGWLTGCEGSARTEAPPSEPLPPQRAAAGVGKQGATLLDDTNAQKLITGPANELFQFQQRAVFDIQIPQALNLYKALHGRAPRNHQEFMAEIIQANQLVLPELRAGMVYQYNAEREELWVYPADQVPGGN